MNIKSLTNSLFPTEIKSIQREKKLESTSDREPQNQQDGSEQGQRNLSQEELLNAVDYLKNLDGVKNNNLLVRLQQENGINIVFIEDMNGKIIRRIPESELSFLTRKNKKKGNLLDKAG